jgi:hypothetical protein
MSLFKSVLTVLLSLYFIQDCFAQNDSLRILPGNDSSFYGQIMSESNSTLTIQTNNDFITIKKNTIVRRPFINTNLDTCYNDSNSVFKDSNADLEQADENKFKKDAAFNRLRRTADKYTEAELRTVIQQSIKNKGNGLIIMGIGIPIMVSGSVMMILDIKKTDDSNAYDNDEAHTNDLLTYFAGELLLITGGSLTAYGIIKTAKASSRINKFGRLLKIKTGEVSIKINGHGLSLCYQF